VSTGAIRRRLARCCADDAFARAVTPWGPRSSDSGITWDGWVAAAVRLRLRLFLGLLSRYPGLLDSIRLEVRDAVNAVQEAGEIIKAISGTVARAERLLTMAEKGYEYGVKTKLEVDDAQLNLVQAKGNLARAQRDYLVARVTYEWATGTLGERNAKQ